MFGRRAQFNWNPLSYRVCRRRLMMLLILAFNAICLAQAYFPFLNQRSIYLDHLLLPGGWWSNPALLGDVHEMALSTSNVLPMGNRLLISDERFLLPLGKWVTLGAGILGAGDYQSGSSNSLVTDTGFSYHSSFAFERPRFQIGAGSILPFIGSLGVLGSLGFDLADDGSKTTAPGFGFGWLSPSLGIPLQLSSSWMFIRHNVGLRFWEVSGKVGVRFIAKDSAVSACAEYSFSPSEGGFGVFGPSPPAVYDAVKALAAVRIFGSWAGLAGFSHDLAFPYHNGSLLHLGIENQQSAGSLFFGGYDVGLRLGTDWLVLHHLWVGINLSRLIKANS
jgi:hypothetical protein